ncbi:hypothetical protein E4U42_000124 [Claviceps africana]|uniref:J domain-containing protein n=1 Tax=Claviceps africana TaxID=83212 RepID=A0A8K0JAE5_9HYPO|nr:hypothetical protein E4U42_000124 [Claviceps africana]
MPPRLALQPRTINTHPHRIPRAFHSSPVVSAAASAAAADNTASKNHYERLNIRHDASPGEIKKSFYSLSKSHHPDVNPSDPRAAHTFSLLSESYTVLSDPSARARYDRDILRLHQQQHRDHHGASYHSSHPAGGRTPSGLSRRRGTFRGPPPSFYKNGAWGAQTERRRRAQAEAEAAQHAHAHAHAHANVNAHTHHGGMGPGSDPFNFAAGDSVPPHFDRDAHARTHRREDDRREDRARRRRALGDDDVEFEPQTSLTGHFFIVAGILGATFLAPLVYLQGKRLSRQERDKQ